MASLEEIAQSLARLEEGQKHQTQAAKDLREDFRDEKRAAHESRAAIHHRLDRQQSDLSHLEETVAISGHIDAQIRGELQALKETVDRNHEQVAPALEEWKRMKTIGVGISGLIALAGLTIGGLVAWAGDAAVTTIRAWLRIN